MCLWCCHRRQFAFRSCRSQPQASCSSDTEWFRPCIRPTRICHCRCACRSSRMRQCCGPHIRPSQCMRLRPIHPCHCRSRIAFRSCRSSRQAACSDCTYTGPTGTRCCCSAACHWFHRLAHRLAGNPGPCIRRTGSSTTRPSHRRKQPTACRSSRKPSQAPAPGTFDHRNRSANGSLRRRIVCHRFRRPAWCSPDTHPD